MTLVLCLAFWFFNKANNSSNASDKNSQSIVSANNTLSREAVVQASLDAADSAADPMADKSLLSDEQIAGEEVHEKEAANVPDLSSATYRKGWNATYQSLDSLYTTEERSLVMLPAWLIGAPQEDRCFGSNIKDCLPKNVLKVNKRFCIETKYSDKSTDIEISEVVGYFGNTTDKNVKTLSFDQYTAARHNIKTVGVKQGVSWRLTKCPF